MNRRESPTWNAAGFCRRQPRKASRFWQRFRGISRFVDVLPIFVEAFGCLTPFGHVSWTSRLWFRRCFILTPRPGEMIQIWRAYFSNGLVQPPDIVFSETRVLKREMNVSNWGWGQQVIFQSFYTWKNQLNRMGNCSCPCSAYWTSPQMVD